MEEIGNRGPAEAARANAQTRINARWAEAATRTVTEDLNPMEVAGLLGLTLEHAFAFRAALRAHSALYTRPLIEDVVKRLSKGKDDAGAAAVVESYMKGELTFDQVVGQAVMASMIGGDDE